jgi:ATP-binding cassette, subfamily B, bacterial HlyB/CyaB
VALVGRSGSGKTTLAKLLLGLYTPTSGKILVDNKDITQIALHSLRAQIGVVDQATFLFSGSIAENIGLGQQNANLKAVKQAAIAAGADEFISAMPMAYETQIGEGGGMLSGGQRQRIAIARALMGNPSLLVFDEATSSLDTESERIIQKNLESICRNRSTIIIAHRLSTVRNADLILVLDKGVLIERGTHQELMAEQGQYYYLNQQQLGTISE